MIATGGEPDGIEELKGTLAIGSLRRNHRKEDVLERGQLRQQVIGLKDESNPRAFSGKVESGGIPKEARIRFKIRTGARGPVMNGEAILR